MAKEAIGEVLLTNVRSSFLDLFERGKPMRDQETGEMVDGKFKGNFLIDKKDPRWSKIDAMLKKAKIDVLTKKYGNDQGKWPKYKPDKVYLRDGNLEDWDGYEGMYYISASSNDPIQLITRRKDPKTGQWIEAKPGEIYAGCYVNILIVVWAQDNKHGKRLNARLKVVQFHAHGEAFSGNAPVDTKEKFAAIEEDEGDSMGQIEDHSGEDDDSGLI